MGGDFNKVLNTNDKFPFKQESLTKSTHLINQFLEENSWFEPWRKIHPKHKTIYMVETKANHYV